MRYLWAFMLLMSHTMCDTGPSSPVDLYNSYRNSVVLIYNSYYYKTQLDNGFEFYYILDKSQPVIFNTEEEAMDNATVKFGSGFIISTKGEIATNRHVVFPAENEQLINKEIIKYFQDYKYSIKVRKNELKADKSKLGEYYNHNYHQLDYDDKIRIIDNYSKIDAEINNLEQQLEELDFNPNNTSTEIVRLFLGIAFDDTHVTSITDFTECVEVYQSDQPEIDLAIIQLKNKQTPTSVKKIFDIDKIDNNSVELNDIVYMIGFNHGYDLANTRSGIKSQFTEGRITQDPDVSRILYSIPTLPGSSGSPVINNKGQLVAVNFAKAEDYQGFSFGVPAIELKKLYDNPTNNVRRQYTISNVTLPAMDKDIPQEPVSDLDYGVNTIEELYDSWRNLDLENYMNQWSVGAHQYLNSQSSRNFEEILANRKELFSRLNKVDTDYSILKYEKLSHNKTVVYVDYQMRFYFINDRIVEEFETEKYILEYNDLENKWLIVENYDYIY